MTYSPGQSHPGAGPAGPPQYAPGPGFPAGPGPQPGFPANPPGPPPPPHRSYTKFIVLGAAAVVVLLAVVGGVGVLIYHNRGKLSGAPLSHTQSASSGKPIYRGLPGCDAMPTGTLSKLVPAMTNTLNVHKDPANSSAGPYSVCQWDNLESDNKPAGVDRTVKVTVQGYADSVTPGIGAARQELTEDRSTAQNLVGKTDGDHTYGAARDLTGLGEGAFGQDYTVHSPTWSYGGTTVELQVDNLLVSLSFDGADKDSPMSATQARTGAETVAHEVVDWLAGCVDCKQ